jgi:hypothetical protein
LFQRALLVRSGKRHDNEQKLVGTARTIKQFTINRERTKIVHNRIPGNWQLIVFLVDVCLYVVDTPFPFPLIFLKHRQADSEP